MHNKLRYGQTSTITADGELKTWREFYNTINLRTNNKVKAANGQQNLKVRSLRTFS